MKKVIVIGCPGSGKSTFSRELQKITHLPLHHLDMMFWNPDKTTVDKETFLERLSAVMKDDEWIIDGNYQSTLEMRLSACDTVFFLDYPTEVCLDGIAERRGKARDDIPWIETEEDGEFVEFITNFNVHQRPTLKALLEKYSDKRIFTFTDREEADAFLHKIKESR